MDLIALKVAEGTSENERVNSLLAVDIVSMADTHIRYVAFQIFRHTIEAQDALKCPNLKKQMIQLGKIYAINDLLNNDPASVYETGFFGTGSA